MIEGTNTIPNDMQKSLNFAVDIADEIMAQSLDFARNEFPLGNRDVIPLAIAHAQIATSLFIAREKTNALTFALENLASAVGDVALALNSGKDAGATDTRTKRAPCPKITRRKA